MQDNVGSKRARASSVAQSEVIDLSDDDVEDEECMITYSTYEKPAPGPKRPALSAPIQRSSVVSTPLLRQPVQPPPGSSSSSPLPIKIEPAQPAARQQPAQPPATQSLQEAAARESELLRDLKEEDFDYSGGEEARFEPKEEPGAEPKDEPGAEPKDEPGGGPGAEPAPPPPPAKAQLSDEQHAVLQKVLNGRNVFLTGSAGTGKSFLLREIVKALKEKYGEEAVFVTASTGIAACNVGGTTLHSFAGTGLGTEDQERLGFKVMNSRPAKDRWFRAKALVVDEISMVDGRFFEKVDYVARFVLRRERPFGGIQLVLCGDFFQLPPVSKSEARVFAFETDAWANLRLECCALKKVFRQQADRALVDALNEVRYGRVGPETVRLLNSRVGVNLGNEDGIEATRLYCRRADCAEENVGRLQHLQGPTVVFNAIDSGDMPYLAQLQKDSMAPQKLELRLGAQVILLKNLDPALGLVNGTRGVITAFTGLDHNWTHSAPAVLASLAAGRPPGPPPAAGPAPPPLPTETLVAPKPDPDAPPAAASREGPPPPPPRAGDPGLPVVHFGGRGGTMAIPWDRFSTEVQGRVVAVRQQVPLALAWALTIHKSQGMTISKVAVEICNVFEAGQAYVALSRAVSLPGLSISGPFFPEKCYTDPKVLEFDAHPNRPPPPRPRPSAPSRASSAPGGGRPSGGHPGFFHAPAAGGSQGGGRPAGRPAAAPSNAAASFFAKRSHGNK